MCDLSSLAGAGICVADAGGGRPDECAVCAGGIGGEPLLFEYDPASGAFGETAEQRALTLLVNQIASFNQARVGFDAVGLIQGKNANRPPVMARAEHVVSALSMMLSWAAMTENAIALAAAMQGSSAVSPRPLPLSPFLDQQGGLEKERVTPAHIDALIDKRIAAAKAANPDANGRAP